MFQFSAYGIILLPKKTRKSNVAQWQNDMSKIVLFPFFKYIYTYIDKLS